MQVTPPPESTVVEERPNVSVKFKNPKNTKFDLVRMWFNGIEVTGNCLKTPSFFSFTPFTVIPEGPVTVRIYVPYADGKHDDCTWIFNLHHPKVIQSVSVVNSQEQVSGYQDLWVRIVGRHGCIASFDIEDIADNIPMEEDPANPGIYNGKYTVKLSDSALKANIVGHIESDFETYSLSCEQHPVIVGSLFQITVFEPEENAEVPLSFTIKGRTRPNCNISVTPNIGLSDNVDAANSVQHNDRLGSISCTSDENGFFECKYGFIMKLPNLHAALTINASDEKGERAITKVLHIKFK
ncbi:hypothetical protein IJT93_04475 [bacterium]|nr:hypothetical protein [bacterium]